MPKALLTNSLNCNMFCITLTATVYSSRKTWLTSYIADGLIDPQNKYDREEMWGMFQWYLTEAECVWEERNMAESRTNTKHERTRSQCFSRHEGDVSDQKG